MADVQELRRRLQESEAELREHMASWEYAYAMGSSRHGATDHPVLERARAKARRLQRRCGELAAQLAEHDL